MLRKKLPRLLLLLVSAILIRGSASVWEEVIYQGAPPATARWEIQTPAPIHLGDLIRATLVITTVEGIKLDLAFLPQEGQTMALPSRPNPAATTSTYLGPNDGYMPSIPSVFPEGELEIISRRTIVSRENGQVITRIEFGLLYLLPLDRTQAADDKRLPQDNPIYQIYWLRNSLGQIYSHKARILMVTANFEIVPRVDDSSSPIFKLFEPSPPETPWPKVRAVGYSLIAVAILLAVWRVGRAVLAVRRATLALQESLPDVVELYNHWRESPDYKTFIEALIVYRWLYRHGYVTQASGSTLFRTEVILYSGVKLGHDEAQAMFEELVKEVGDGDDI